MDLFSFKKIVGTFVMPVPLSVILVIITIFALMMHRKKLAMTSGITALMIMLLSSTPFLPDRLLGNLEQTYKQFDMSQPVSTIVVLGCGHNDDGRLPLTAQISPCSSIRVMEAVRIFRNNPQARIFTSGRSLTQPFSNAEMNKRLLIALGVPESQITKFESPKDTREEAILLSKTIQDAPFVLVTSASHMARSVRLFESEGTTPIAAPTEHLVSDLGTKGWLYYAPSVRHLEKSQRWWYETMGHTWLTIRGWFES